MHVADFATRLLDLADETAEIRSHAHSTKDHKLLLQAVSSERDTLTVLLARLGVDADEIVEELEAGRVLIQALLAVLPRYPQVAREFAAFFASKNLNAMADDLTVFADKAQRHLEAVKDKP